VERLWLVPFSNRIEKKSSRWSQLSSLSMRDVNCEDASHRDARENLSKHNGVVLKSI